MPFPEDLEHLPSSGEAAGAPLLFVHGAFGTPWMWMRSFGPFFAERGHDVYALALRGAGSSYLTGPEPGLTDYLDDLEAAVRAIGARPVVVAHSLGALVAQMALGRVPMAALALLAPVPPTGMLWSSLRLVLDAPALWARTALSAADAGFATTASTREALFTARTPEALVRETYVNLTAQPVRPLLEAQWPRYIPRAGRLRVPVLTVAAERDRLIPVDVVERTARHHDARHVTVAGAGHALMLDHGWEDAARHLLDWLAGVAAPGAAARAGEAPA